MLRIKSVETCVATMIDGSECNTHVKPVYFPYECQICKELALMVIKK